MKYLIFLVLFFGLNVFANVGMRCEVVETKNRQVVKQVVTVMNSGESHGTIFNISFIAFQKELSGFVAFIKGTAVTNVIHKPSGFVFSTNGDLNNGSTSLLQFWIPTKDQEPMQGLAISCVMIDDQTDNEENKAH